SRRVTQHPVQLIHARSFSEGTAAGIPVVSVPPARGRQNTRLHVTRLLTLYPVPVASAQNKNTPPLLLPPRLNQTFFFNVFIFLLQPTHPLATQEVGTPRFSCLFSCATALYLSCNTFAVDENVCTAPAKTECVYSTGLLP
ncbi:unnamed protein product, partial [Ectocarpus sp. 12 AP-2014]